MHSDQATDLEEEEDRDNIEYSDTTGYLCQHSPWPQLVWSVPGSGVTWEQMVQSTRLLAMR